VAQSSNGRAPEQGARLPVPVHNHSEYSALDGYSTPGEIAARIKEIGLPGAFLTDHGTVAGFPEFRKAMGDAGLFAGYGMEAYQARGSVKDHEDAEGNKFKKGQDSFHLVLLAETAEGYRNLLKLSDAAHRDGFYYDPRLDLKMLADHKDGIIATTACFGSLVNQTLWRTEGKEKGPLDELMKIFSVDGDNLYVEIHTYDTDDQRELNEFLVGLAGERGLPLLYANDAHYAEPGQYETHEVLLAAQLGEKMGSLKYANWTDADGQERHHPPCLYIMDQDEVRHALSGLDPDAVEEAIDNSHELMVRCSGFEPPSAGNYLPKYLPLRPSEHAGYDSRYDFENQVAARLNQLEAAGLEDADAYWARAETEVNALLEKGLQDYFLIVKDYIDHAKGEGRLVGSGRGSVGGSLAAYLLGLHNVDPIKYDLQFERFWNPGRAEGLPDIDTDFEKGFRHSMIEYVKKRWGPENVLLIGTHMRLRPKSAILKAAQVLYEKAPYQDLDAINKVIETTDSIDAGQLQTWDQIFNDEEPHRLNQEARDRLAPWIEKYPKLFEIAESISGRIATYGVHASAVVISDQDLRDLLPGRSAADKEKGERVMVTQAEMHQVEKAGFPKFDFLGLKTLDQLMRAAELTGIWGTGEGFDGEAAAQYFWGLDEDEIPQEAYKLIHDGHNLGLFQMDTSQPAKRIGREMRPSNPLDLAAIVALNNPGPQRSGAVKDYCARKKLADENGQDDPAWYLHESLRDILKPTYGVFVYQEQIIKFFNEKLGWNLSDSDHVRKVVGKRLVKEMLLLKPRYMKDCVERLSMAEPVAKEIWEAIEEFSRYGFNKAHAVAYGAKILGWTVRAKHDWPTEFTMAGIEYNPDDVAAYVNEARGRGVQILPPDANVSEVTTSKTEDGAIIYGLRDIKGIGTSSAQWVVDNGPWDDPDALLRAIKAADPRPCNLGHYKTLARAGALDWLGARPDECPDCEGKGRVSGEVPRADPTKGMKKALVDCETCEANGFVVIDIPDDIQLASDQTELLGVALVDVHAALVEKNADRIAQLEPLSEVEVAEPGTVLKVPGVVVGEVKDFRVRADAKRGAGRKMARLKIAWGGDEVSFVAFPEEYEDYGYMLKTNSIGEFTLKASERGPQLVKGYKYT